MGQLPNSLHVRIRTELTSAQHGTFLLDVEFVARPGITILFGPSGSGKTTILQCVAGLLHPENGSIKINGVALDDCESGVHVAVNRRSVGYVFQNLALFPHMTVEQNIHYGIAGSSGAEKRQRTAAILDSFHIPNLLHRHPSEISGGERQRVALARALVMDPQVLLLDEPMSALDGVTKAKIMDDLRAWNAGRRIPILYVTHGRREVFALGEHVVVLEKGSVLAEGTPQAVLEAPRYEMLAQLAGFENIFEATVVAQHEGHGTMTCRLDHRIRAVRTPVEPISKIAASASGAVLLEAPLVRLGEGAQVRLAIRAGDILLSTEPPRALSARNVFEGRLSSMAREGVMVIAEIVAHDIAFTVDLTPGAVESLRLETGSRVWLVVKTYSCHLLQRRDGDVLTGAPNRETLP